MHGHRNRHKCRGMRFFFGITMSRTPQTTPETLTFPRQTPTHKISCPHTSSSCSEILTVPHPKAMSSLLSSVTYLPVLRDIRDTYRRSGGRSGRRSDVHREIRIQTLGSNAGKPYEKLVLRCALDLPRTGRNGPYTLSSHQSCIFLADSELISADQQSEAMDQLS
jgi:hypothetical protein